MIYPRRIDSSPARFPFHGLELIRKLGSYPLPRRQGSAVPGRSLGPRTTQFVPSPPTSGERAGRGGLQVLAEALGWMDGK